MTINLNSPIPAHKPGEQARFDALTEALRDAARWLESAGNTCGLQSLKDAATRAEATLAEVSR